MELFRDAHHISFSDNSTINVNNYGPIVPKEFYGKRFLDSENEGEDLSSGSREKRLRLRSVLDDSLTTSISFNLSKAKDGTSITFLHQYSTPNLVSASLRFHTTDCLDRKGAMNYMGALDRRGDQREAAEVRNSLILPDSESNSGSDEKSTINLASPTDPHWDLATIYHSHCCYEARLIPGRYDDEKWVWHGRGKKVHRGRRDSVPPSWAPQKYSLKFSAIEWVYLEITNQEEIDSPPLTAILEPLHMPRHSVSSPRLLESEEYLCEVEFGCEGNGGTGSSGTTGCTSE
ncbi:hypothetical protein D9758_017232 [Tetrapyrgos nigripes]|uniref:Uncharacterized protein n=1 Tax=Tetrapyrgos nigripes TaxID=182062 RepID=A0A8H5FG26_9AGAR|nr:hypothetical protein D9758_017232 [Tetrapyrgos nigripes]